MTIPPSNDTTPQFSDAAPQTNTLDTLTFTPDFGVPKQSIEPQNVQETIVVPPSTPNLESSLPPLDTNPFMPQQAPEGQTGTSGDDVHVVKAGSSWTKRIILIFVAICIVAGIIAFVKFGLSFMAQNQTITLHYWGLWERSDIITPIIQEYEAKNPKVKIQYTFQNIKQYRERLQAAILRGEGPDMFRFHNTWVPMLKNDLALVPPTTMGVTEFSSAFYPTAVSDLIGGQTSIYGIPLMIDGIALYYNEDLFAAAGITSPPATWEELTSFVPKITKAEGNSFIVSGIALGTADNIEHFSDILGTMFMQNGAKLTSIEGITSKEAEETMIFYKNFATPGSPVYSWNDTMDNSIYAFSIGKVAMIFAPSWRAFELKQMNPKLKFKIAPIPQLPGNSVTWATYWVEGVNAKSKYQKQAWDFIKFLTSKDTAIQLYSEEQKTRLFGEPYARVELGSTIAKDPYVGSYITQAPQARSFPLASRTFDNGLNDSLIQYLKNAVNGISKGGSPQQELATMAKGFMQVFQTYGLVSAQPQQ